MDNGATDQHSVIGFVDRLCLFASQNQQITRKIVEFIHTHKKNHKQIFCPVGWYGLHYKLCYVIPSRPSFFMLFLAWDFFLFGFVILIVWQLFLIVQLLASDQWSIHTIFFLSFKPVSRLLNELIQTMVLSRAKQRKRKKLNQRRKNSTVQYILMRYESYRNGTRRLHQIVLLFVGYFGLACLIW